MSSSDSYQSAFHELADQIGTVDSADPLHLRTHNRLPISDDRQRFEPCRCESGVVTGAFESQQPRVIPIARQELISASQFHHLECGTVGIIQISELQDQLAGFVPVLKFRHVGDLA